MEEMETPQEPGGSTDVLIRSFEVEMQAGDGRTVDVRIVPYGVRATVADGQGGLARGIPYEEEFVPGVFSHQVNAANRVLANFEHQKGIAGVVGHGLTLREASDGFHGSFRLHETPDGDKALLLANAGVLRGISLEARPVKSVRSASGVIQRVKAHLSGIAFCREPAYTGAEVLAIREQDVLLDEELLPVQPDPEMLDRCRRLGITLPQRYEAHPVETDTPVEAGTSEDGTRLEAT